MMHMMSPQSETAKICSNVLLIPVLLGAIESWEHDRKDNANVITD